MNEARKIITTLTQPIAVIANTIQENIALMEEEQKRLATLNVWEQNLSQKLMTPMYYIDVQIMPNPRTICASEKCTERRIGKYGEATIHYKVKIFIFYIEFLFKEKFLKNIENIKINLFTKISNKNRLLKNS